MRANQYDDIKTLVEIHVKQLDLDLILPAGIKGTIVECYTNPIECYDADMNTQNEALKHRLINITLYPGQFELDNHE